MRRQFGVLSAAGGASATPAAYPVPALAGVGAGRGTRPGSDGTSCWAGVVRRTQVGITLALLLASVALASQALDTAKTRHTLANAAARLRGDELAPAPGLGASNPVALATTTSTTTTTTTAPGDLERLVDERVAQRLRELGFVVGASPPAKPSTGIAHLPREEQEKLNRRGPFGGRGDPAHLGGFVTDDGHGRAPAVWQYLLKVWNVRSVVDVGCGRGKHLNWFLEHGADVLCVEGSHDAVNRTFLPKSRVVEHDFSRGPWWPERTYDLALSVEFVEHVSRQFIGNYVPIFKRAAVVVVTHAVQPGYHHVETHDESWWWQSRFTAHGLVYSEQLTKLLRDVRSAARHGTWYQTAEVYINPSVASRPEHAHVFGGPGCLKNSHNPGDAPVPENATVGRIGNVPCAGANLLPARFRPVWTGPADPDWAAAERLEAKVMTGALPGTAEDVAREEKAGAAAA